MLTGGDAEAGKRFFGRLPVFVIRYDMDTRPTNISVRPRLRRLRFLARLLHWNTPLRKMRIFCSVTGQTTLSMIPARPEQAHEILVTLHRTLKLSG